MVRFLFLASIAQINPFFTTSTWWGLMPNRIPVLLLSLSISGLALFGQGRIEGRVQQAGGEGIVNALVTFNQVSPAPQSPNEQPATLFARTDAQGHFVLANVPAGQYGATTTALGFQAGFWGNLSARPDGTWKEMVFTLAKGGTDVRGAFRSNLTLDSSLKVSAARISQDSGDMFYAPVVTPSGFDICLGPGDYILRAEANEYTWGTVPLHVENDPNQKVDLRIDQHDPPVTPEIRTWLDTHAMPFDLAATDEDAGGMKPFQKVIGKARLVAFGEFAHGSHEFFQVGQRALKFLVEKRGFNVVCIEAPFTEALALNRYVLGGEGKPEEALNQLGFWIWNNEEMVSTLQWLRTYNEGKPASRKVRFYGFDLQSGGASARAIISYLSANDPGMLKWAEPRLSPIAKIPTDYSVYGDDLKKFCVELTNKLKTDRAMLEAKNGAEAFEVACEQVDILSQNCDWALEKRVPGKIRDRAMAENIRWIYAHRGENAKLVIWAHNGHAADQDAKSAEGTPMEAYAFDSMGHHLREMFGDQLVIVGSDCYGGAFNAIGTPMEVNLGLTQFRFPLPSPNSFSSALSKIPSPSFLLDVRRALGSSSPAVRNWFRAVHILHNAGAEFDPQAPWMAFAPENVGDQYDAILYTKESTATNPTAGGRRDYRPASEVKVSSPSNLGFEAWDSNGKPTGWFLTSSMGYQVAQSVENPHEGKSSIRLYSTGKGQERAGAVIQTIDAGSFRGKTVKVTGWVRAHLNPSMGGASVSMIVTRSRENLANPEMMKGQIQSPEWSEQSLTCQVPNDAVSFSIILSMRGAGETQFDDFAIQTMP